MVENRRDEEKEYEELFIKLLVVFGELRLQCDSDYRARVFDHSHRLTRKYGHSSLVSKMRLIGFENYPDESQESHDFVIKMIDVFGAEYFLEESYDLKTTIRMAERALKERGFEGVTELQLVGIKEIMNGDLDDFAFGRVPSCVIEEQRAKKLYEQITKILNGFEE